MARSKVTSKRADQATPEAKNRTGLRLRTKLTLVFSTLFAIFAAPVIFVSVLRSQSSLVESARRFVSLRAESMADQARGPLLNNNDVDLARIIAERFNQQSDLLFAAVISGDGKIRTCSPPLDQLPPPIREIVATRVDFDGTQLREEKVTWQNNSCWVLDATTPVLINQDQRWGNVRIIVSLEPVQHHVKDTALLLAGGAAAILVFGCGVIFAVSLRISNPIEELALSTRSIASGKFEEIPHLRTGGEIGMLADHFKEMAARLAEMHDELELRARESEDKRLELDTVLSSLVDGVLAVNSDMTVRFVNWAARRLLKLPLDKLTGTTLQKVVSNVRLCELFEGAIGDPTRPIDQEINVDHPKGGSRLIVRIRIAQIALNDGGQVSGVVGVLQDVTKLRFALKSEKRLLTNVSHELRTPISVLRLATTNLKRYPEMANDRRIAILETLDQQSNRLHRMIENLLDVSQQELKGPSLRKSSFRLQDVIREAATEAANSAQDSAIQVRQRNAEDPVIAYADKSRILQLVIHLIHNGIRFSKPEGTVVVWASTLASGQRTTPVVGTTALGPVDRICVYDRGIGIQSKELPRIFERFYRGEDDVHWSEGTGVGLTIVKEIVQKHGGAIFLTTIPKKGTLVVVELPTPIKSSGSDDHPSLDAPDSSSSQSGAMA